MAREPKKVLPLKNVRAQVESRSAEEREKYGSDGSPPELATKLIMECLNSNEFGDGLLFCALHRGKLVYNASSKEWLRWTGHHWELDVLDSARAAVESVALRYLQELVPLAEQIREAMQADDKPKQNELFAIQDALRKRISRLRSDRGRKNCLQFAMSSPEHLSIKGEQLDQNPLLFPCANGVIDLTTGKLRDGRPEDYMVKASPVEFHGIDADRALWVQTLLEIYDGDQELVDFLQRLFGFAMSGLCSPAVFPVFHGKGRNGKSLIFDVITMVMGPLGRPIQSELFLDQGRGANNNPGRPTPEIMALRGMRLAVGSETDDGRKVSASRVKLLTGGDMLTARSPNDKYDVTFRPTHTLALLTNHKPQAPADDFAFWERCLLIAHRLSFVNREPRAADERRADSSRPGELMKTLPGILGWMVEGFLMFQAIGLCPPKSVTEATAEYQREEDFILDFIEARLVPGDGKGFEVGATDLYDEFKSWWLASMSKDEKKVPAQKRVGKWLGQRFERRKVSGTYKYYGVRLKTEEERKPLEAES